MSVLVVVRNQVGRRRARKCGKIRGTGTRWVGDTVHIARPRRTQKPLDGYVVDTQRGLQMRAVGGRCMLGLRGDDPCLVCGVQCLVVDACSRTLVRMWAPPRWVLATPPAPMANSTPSPNNSPTATSTASRTTSGRSAAHRPSASGSPTTKRPSSSSSPPDSHEPPRRSQTRQAESTRRPEVSASGCRNELCSRCVPRHGRLR